MNCETAILKLLEEHWKRNDPTVVRKLTLGNLIIMLNKEYQQAEVEASYNALLAGRKFCVENIRGVDHIWHKPVWQRWSKRK